MGSRPVHALDGVPIEHMSEGETGPLPILSARGVTKSFPGVRALDAVDFDIRPGEVHALCGENGAGKSTLMRVLAGTFRADAGTITFKGSPVDFRGTREALGQGILLVHQEISLVPELTVAENIFLGNLPSRGAGIVWRRDLYRRARAILAEAGGEFEKIDPRAKVGTLSFARQQMVEIARAMAFNCTVVIFDEPTSSLTASEAVSLFETINRLKARGVGIVYISHKMPEIFALSDRITVLRDGQMRGTRITRDTNEDEITRLMIGRSLESYFERPVVTPGEELLRVEGLAVAGLRQGHRLRRPRRRGARPLRPHRRRPLRGDGSDLRRAAEDRRQALLEGHGRRHPQPARSGQARHRPRPRGPQAPGPRARHERAGQHDAGADAPARALPPAGPRRRAQGLRPVQAEARHPRRLARDAVGTLSGGNQQKIALAKWMAMDPKLLILDEPTRGIDVGAKAEIHSLVAKLAESGVAVILISSELPEILGLASRILTLREGRITASLDGRTATEESVMSALVTR